MPKILSVNSYHYRRGGSDVVYLAHAELMQSQGWESGFFSMHHPRNLQTPWAEFFVDELEFGESYPLHKKIVMATKSIYSYEAQKKLRKLLDRFRPDVAHLHCIYHHLSPSILPILSNAGIPTVLTAHDLKIACPAYKMLNQTGVCERCKTGSVANVIRYRCIRESLVASVVVAAESALQRTLNSYRRYIDRIVVPSQFFIDKFVEWGWPREKFVYIPNYVDASQFSPSFAAGNYFLYFGRLAPEKGIATLLRAAAAAGVNLKIVGTGPEHENLQVLNTQLGGAAEFLGYQSGAALHALIGGARAVVLPSEWYENAPMSVLESFAMGKPVIGANIGGIPELIRDNESGWIFESADVESLTTLLVRTQRSKDAEIESIGRSARQWVERHFHRDGYLQSMLGVYADIGVRM